MKAVCSICLLLILTACTKPPELQTSTILVFGTLLEITLYDVDKATAEVAFNRLDSAFQKLHSQWTPWQDSDLSRINTAIAEGRTFTLPDSIRPLIEISQDYYRQSDGLFNPAIGGLIKRWQFHLHDQPGITPPPEKDIRQLVASHPAMSDIKITADRAHSTNTAVDLNFGAFAKGYGIELAMRLLHDMGIDNAIINAGGDLTVSGRHGERDWNIGIRHPREDGAIASVSVSSGESVFTSGDYERFYYYEGRRYHHILDPRTGYPATGATSVTVIDNDAGKADAAATALFVAGVEDWQKIARQMQIRYVMLIDPQGRIYMNPAMAQRIELQNPSTANIVLSEPLY